MMVRFIPESSQNPPATGRFTLPASSEIKQRKMRLSELVDIWPMKMLKQVTRNHFAYQCFTLLIGFLALYNVTKDPSPVRAATCHPEQPKASGNHLLHDRMIRNALPIFVLMAAGYCASSAFMISPTSFFLRDFTFARSSLLPASGVHLRTCVAITDMNIVGSKTILFMFSLVIALKLPLGLQSTLFSENSSAHPPYSQNVAHAQVKDFLNLKASSNRNREPLLNFPSLTKAAVPSMSAVNEGHQYIIVGGGTAGCVLANRLTAQKDNSVLVLEAGSPKFNARDIKMPIGILRLFRSVFDWDFQSDGEEFITSDSIYLCRGKVLGGSSCTNVMLYHRGEETDYDAWGVEGWTGKDVLPYFKKAENNRSKKKGRFHNKGGLIQVENTRYMNSLTKRFFKACEQAGMQKNEDFNDWSHSQEGFGRFQVAQKNGRRCSAASSYLKQAVGRKNLDVQTSAQTTKIVIKDGRATGVEYVQDGEKRIANLAPGGEVLLAGGAVSSPHVLLLSGVGPAEHLLEKDIEVKSDLPGVGKNLRDHPAVTVMLDINEPVSITDEVLVEGSGAVNKMTALRWLLTGTGPLTSPGCENGAFYKTSAAKEASDLQLRFVPGRGTSPDGVKSYNTIGTQGRPPSGVTLQGHTLKLETVAGIVNGRRVATVTQRDLVRRYHSQVVAIRPKSEGVVQLRSSDPFENPRITTNYLQKGEDLESLTHGIKIARELFHQEAFKGMVGKEVFPGKDNLQLDEYVKSTVHSANALVGTCKMGVESDEMAVVDPELKVRGVSGLRVVDSSVMPSIPGGQTAAPTIMIAEKAADMLMPASS